MAFSGKAEDIAIRQKLEEKKEHQADQQRCHEILAQGFK
jgi:hypothetical protein